MHFSPDDLSLLTRFTLTMALVILLPRLAERLRLPAVVGFILAGVVLGPQVANVLHENMVSVRLFAELGKLLFMFFVGFEVDIEQFNRSRSRSLLFGALTFMLPFVAGVLLGRLTGAGWNSSALIGSLIASHTLLAFPILQRLGLTQHPSVLMVVGGTIFTDIASMLVLAITVSIHQIGFSWSFLGRELLELAIFVPAVFFGAGTLARKAIVRFGQTAEVRVMILLAVIALCAEGAQIIQLEGIVGAFLAGIAVKRAVRGKFAVEQLEVVSHALFIPAFFLTTGFLVNFRLMGTTATTHPGNVLGLIAALATGKYLAARLATMRFPESRPHAGFIFSLSLPQMAATLASAVVAYKTLNAAGAPLLSEEYVNAVLVLVVTTCVFGPILTARNAPVQATQRPVAEMGS